MKRPTNSFDDVLLVPQHSDIESREEIDLNRALGNKIYKIPIMSDASKTSLKTIINSAIFLQIFAPI